MRFHAIEFDPILTLNPWTGEQSTLTVHSLVRFFQRHNIAKDLSRHIVPSVWGPFCDDGNPEMDFEAELRLAKRLERGLHVLFHMADIARDTERLKPSRKPLAPVVSGRLFVLGKMLDEYDELPQHRKQLMSFEEYTNHVYTVLKWGYVEADIGRRRLEFRGWLDEQTEIDFHASLRMLRELMERMLLRHGPKDWHRDAKNEYSVISWFLLKQPPRSLAKLFLSPQNDCCDIDVKATDCGVRKCHFSDPLDNYWKAWKNVPDLGCQDCDCKRRVRSWSVKPALIDARGRDDVLSTLQSTRPLFSSYLRIRSLAKSPNNPELQQARSELETTLTDLTADLDDLVESVRAIEQDPYRFGLELEEVQRRRSLVNDVGAEIEKMREELQRTVTASSGGGKGTGALPNPADFDNVLSPSAEDQGDDYYAAMEQQRQMELMHEQDEQLDGVFRTVGNLRQQADDMGRELEEQGVMIDEVDTLADRVGGKLQNGMSRLKYIIRKNEDTMSSFCIAVLIFVLVLLLILLIVL
ncbi:SNARE domain protein [Aspergillus welwitschiae]|uniref:t-SNARE affecting a late Golgi compartment protein 1 n=1 Tax=Aspergillus welwitschiae TaxID=1341132 RepID=A0A3F3Q0N3_9EURO|nr:SNARE domain protein [Aspergillus welwitschiae]RDH32769.1 SNARE domain protein [Aspergillus welwitschiae]